MCGRVIQSSGPFRYAIVDGMNVRDSRVHLPAAVERSVEPGTARHPPQSQDWRGVARSAALGADTALMRRSERRPEADQRQVRDGVGPALVPGRVPRASLHRAGGRLLRVEGDQGRSSPTRSPRKTAVRSASPASGRTGSIPLRASGSARSRSSRPTQTTSLPTSTTACP
jgi:hypothetical protein